MPSLILADRSDLFRRSVSSVLTREGFDVLCVEHGHKVLALANEKQPAVILLDTEVTEPGGLETLMHLKRDPRTRRLPVLIASRDSTPTAVSAAFKVGAEGFFIKPIDLNALLKAISNLHAPVPVSGARVEAHAGDRLIVTTLRSIDESGMIALDRHMTDLEAEAKEKVWDPRAEAGIEVHLPPGTALTLGFEGNKTWYVQRALLVEENDQGLLVYPVGQPVKGTEPAPHERFPVGLKARYIEAGTFAKLAEVRMLWADGIILPLATPPAPNAELIVTLYPAGAGDGVTLKGRVQAIRQSDKGFDVEVALSDPVGMGFLNVLAEQLTGRPLRPYLVADA